jgi:hypothetical protein
VLSGGHVLLFHEVRIAVSGTHCSGKSTLVEDFLALHGDYVHEPEPYEWLTELHGEPLGEELTAGDVCRQLEVSVERWCSYDRGARVVGERAPLDFVAYIRALTDLRRQPGLFSRAIEAECDLVARGMAHVDLLVVLPLNDADRIAAPEWEDLELRAAMNDCLLEIVNSDELLRLGCGLVEVVQIEGARQARLAAMELAIRRSVFH